MLQSQPMEIVLETADYQNFWVRSVPMEASPRATSPGCRILQIAPDQSQASPQSPAAPPEPIAASTA